MKNEDKVAALNMEVMVIMTKKKAKGANNSALCCGGDSPCMGQ